MYIICLFFLHYLYIALSEAFEHSGGVRLNKNQMAYQSFMIAKHVKQHIVSIMIQNTLNYYLTMDMRQDSSDRGR